MASKIRRLIIVVKRTKNTEAITVENKDRFSLTEILGLADYVKILARERLVELMEIPEIKTKVKIIWVKGDK